MNPRSIPRSSPGRDTVHSVPADAPLVTLRDAVVSVAATGDVLLRIPALDILPGQRIVIAGASGSGKSLLLGSLTGRWAPGLTFTGTRRSALSRIGLVPQRGLEALHPLMTIARQLRAVTGAPQSRVDEVLSAVGLPDEALHRRRPTEISGGQAQRVAVAMAVLTDSPLILADEPTSALDHHSRDVLLDVLDAVVSPTQTLIVSTHDPVVADRLAARRLDVGDRTVTERAIGPNPSDASRGDLA